MSLGGSNQVKAAGLAWIGRGIRGAIGSFLSGGNPITGAIGGIVNTPPSPQPPPQWSSPPMQPPMSFAPPVQLGPMPGSGFGGFQQAGFPLLGPALGAGAGAAVRMGGRYAMRLAQATASWARRNPAWASTIGIAGIQAALQSGQLPMPKRRRARGITAHELRAFKRVAKFTSKYCAPVRRAMKAPVMTRKGK